jgi:hypothetical protein
MSRNDKSTKRVASGSGAVSVTKTVPTKTGRVVWQVTHKDGKRRTLMTSSSSNVAIKDAVLIYSKALKSLAKR